MRVIMKKAAPGIRNVRGGHVMELQIGLEQVGFGCGGIDGVFGGQTERAVKRWQLSQNTAADGQVDDLTWFGITRSDPPSLFRRCLALTAAFEGHGYLRVAGNWDNAYLTWGIIGFTLRHGNLGKVLHRADDRHPELLAHVIGESKRDELLTIIDVRSTDQRLWANEISVQPQRYKIRQDWEDAFEALGQKPEIRAIQDEVARDVYWKQATEDFCRFNLDDELDLALCFDTAVQNGGINNTKAQLIEAAVQASPNATGEQRRILFADAIADGSSERFSEDVRSRRRTIAKGKGIVHGAAYSIDNWGIEPPTVDSIALR